ncbi:hypothetical protein LZQ00_11690 [Sphingobacterium sp. SRCM116780]|uniref:hypothetical protein n=1 Tax=Sphingobacterium sp. SRCM116780 TaxID=2907623 RepID=UPI001F2367D8|nr:hypothetical protein [Sphingobacterium sp. SRCM116780]UIR54941.1 hypothetical protein LZQ00_11690 [Sphingobacterium sp. SRCM116780]
MFINNKPTTNAPLDRCKIFADGINYINTSQWLLAYTAFAHLCQGERNKSVTLLYNMALCHCSAKENSKAIEVLNEALTQISIPSVSHHAINHLSSNLFIYEYENSYYRLALNETAVVLCTNSIKLRIRRLLVDVYLELENWQEILRLALLPEMNKCQNVQEALAIAKSKTNT